MSGFRFSLLGLAGLVAVIALGCASLVHASLLWAAIVWWSVLLALLFGTLAAVLATGARRYGWIGFAMFGWAYVLTMIGPFAGISDWLQVNEILQNTASAMPNPMTSTQTVVTTEATGMYRFTIRPVTIPAQSPDYIIAFVRTSQALLTFVLACLGGFAGRSIYERNHSALPP
jgi:hypothetical protein